MLDVLPDLIHNTEGAAGPIAPDSYKRAIYREPPPLFVAEVLSPHKFGKSYVYGMRICPLQHDGIESNSEEDARSRTGKSSTRSSEFEEYIIWRKWDDCLWLQDLLESEYAVQSREKRRRLAQGKGVKKNGVYMNSKMASSFESLPPGPDPNYIAKDIHEFLPKLTKKSTLFRANQATLDERQRQFATLIESLFRDDLPTLIMELRETRSFRDFFGYWRRDRDLANKEASENLKRGSVASFSSSRPSFYFRASSLSLQAPTIQPSEPPSTPKRKPVQIRNSPWSRFSPKRSEHTHSESDQPSPSLVRTSSPAAFSGSRTSSSDESEVHMERQIHAIFPDSESYSSSTLDFPMSPTSQEDDFISTSRYLESEDVFSALSSLDSPVNEKQNSNQNCIIFTDVDIPLSPMSSGESLNVPDMFTMDVTTALPFTPTNTTVSSAFLGSGPSSRQPSLYDRPLSRISEFDSIYSDTDPSHLGSTDSFLPSWLRVDEPSVISKRTSIASMNSVMTNSSVDRILPRRIPKISKPTRKVLGPRSSPRPYSPSMTVSEESQLELDEGLLDDLYSHDLRISNAFDSDSRVETSRLESLSYYFPPAEFDDDDDDDGFSMQWVSPVENTPTQSPATPEGVILDRIAIKVFLTDDSIVSFRAHVGISYRILRRRIYDKFARQEGIPLPETFSVGYLAPKYRNLPNASSILSGRSTVMGHMRSNSDSSEVASTWSGHSALLGRLRSHSVTSSVSLNEDSKVLDPTVQYIESERDWQDILSTCEGKLFLRVF